MSVGVKEWGVIISVWFKSAPGYGFQQGFVGEVGIGVWDMWWLEIGSGYGQFGKGKVGRYVGVVYREVVDWMEFR